MSESVFKYPGGKAKIARWIADRLPPPGSYKVFVDVFGGAANVLLEVMRRHEQHVKTQILFVYNDLDSNIINFFRVLRDPAIRERLIETLRWTPYARQEYISCLKDPPVGDPVEQARRFFVACQQSYGGQGIYKGQWQYHPEAGWAKSGPQRWFSSRNRLEKFGEVFQKVQLECLDFADLIPRYDREGVLFYFDPPYYPGARRDKKLYRCEMSAERHAELAKVLNGIKSMAALSGYRCPEYDAWYSGWERHDLETVCHLASVGGEKYRGNRPGRVESLWLNPAAVKTLKGGRSEQLAFFKGDENKWITI